MKSWTLAAALLVVLVPVQAAAQEPPDSAVAPPASAVEPPVSQLAEPQPPPPPPPPQEPTEFDRLTRGHTYRPGFFDTYERDGQLLMVVPEERLGELFLLSFEASHGPGAYGLYGGTTLEREARLVSLEKRQGRIMLVQHPHLYTAAPGTPQERAVDLTYGTSVLATARIVATRDSTDYLVNVYDWFVSDLSAISERVRDALSAANGRSGGGLGLDESRSWLEAVRSFPRNMTIDARLTFRVSPMPDLRSVPDGRFVPVTVHTRLVALPEVPMPRREGDDRVGYFLSAQKDFTGDRGQDFFVRYVRKWRLECAGPPDMTGLCDPVKPITYYVDRTVPEEYRGAMLAGIEAWDEAFEAAGFRDAIRAELLPEGADPEDIQYPTIRWNVSDPPSYNAIGPAVVDPRTGEILDADILIEANIVLGFKNAWRFEVSPAAAVEEMLDAAPAELEALAQGAETSSFASEMQSQGMLLRTMLAARGELGPSEPVPDEYVYQAVKWVTMHEVGHTLGLRHNFRSSTDTPNERLQDPEWTRANGVYSSVMEYPTPNIAPSGQPNGDFYNRGIGPYDVWAIAYGYTPDPERAAQIARLAAQPGHSYGTDEDARGAGALDPTINPYDLGKDPLRWAAGRATMIRSTWSNVPAISLEDDGTYASATYVFNSLLFQYARALSIGVKYIGGQYFYRDHVGDPGGRGPWANVPRARQLEALEFLMEYAFSPEAFALPPEVLQRFGANRWSHWGNDMTFDGRIDYPYHESVLDVQRALVEHMTSPMVFSRIRDAELKYGASEVLTIPELLQVLQSAIWSELDQGTSIPAMRRDLQRAYLDRMIELVTDAPDGTPADARSVARYTLEQLEGELEAALRSRRLDAYTRAHLNESRARVERALAAGLELAN